MNDTFQLSMKSYVYVRERVINIICRSIISDVCKKFAKNSLKKMKNPCIYRGFIVIVVGRTGFEPATPWSQTKYSTGLNYLPNFSF